MEKMAPMPTVKRVIIVSDCGSTAAKANERTVALDGRQQIISQGSFTGICRPNENVSFPLCRSVDDEGKPLYAIYLKGAEVHRLFKNSDNED